LSKAKSIDQLPIASAMTKLEGLQVDAYYGLNPAPQSPIGSECVGMKDEMYIHNNNNIRSMK